MKNVVRPVRLICQQAQVTEIINTVKLKSGLLKDHKKIFCIGFNKTATTSFHALFESFGILAMDGPHWRKKDDWHVHYQFQAFSDGPPWDFKALDKEFPGSLFILNVRDLDQWIDSRIEHIRHRQKDTNYKPKGIWKISKSAIKKWYTRRESHHLDVLDYFSLRKESLLTINFIRNPHAAEIIANFIGKTTTHEKPYVRSTPKLRSEFGLVNERLIEDSLTELGVDKSDWKYDIFCPSTAGAEISARFPHDTSELVYPIHETTEGY
jgi:hypothetical protein